MTDTVSHTAPLTRWQGDRGTYHLVTIGDTSWKSSVFPQNKSSEWILLVSKKVMRAEDLAAGDPVSIELELL